MSPIQATGACPCDTLRDHGGDPWWLCLSRCSVCGQHWTGARDERIHDDYFLKRLETQTVTGIVDKGIQPLDFLTYQQVLTRGRTMSTPPRFHNAFACSLQFTWLPFWKVRLFGAAKLPS